MGVMKFRLPSNDLANRLPDYRKAYVTGLDRTPGRVGVELRNGMMTCSARRPRAAGSSSPGRSRGTARRSSARRPWPSGPRPMSSRSSWRGASSTTCGTSSPTGPRWGCARPPSWSARWKKPSGPSSAPPRPSDQPEACLAAARDAAQLASNAGDLLMEAYTDPGLPEPAGDDLEAPDPPGLRPGRRSPGHPAGPGLDPDVQRLPGRRRLAAGGAGRGAVPLGPARRPARLVPPQSPGDRGRAR